MALYDKSSLVMQSTSYIDTQHFADRIDEIVKLSAHPRYIYAHAKVSCRGGCVSVQTIKLDNSWEWWSIAKNDDQSRIWCRGYFEHLKHLGIVCKSLTIPDSCYPFPVRSFCFHTEEVESDDPILSCLAACDGAVVEQPWPDVDKDRGDISRRVMQAYRHDHGLPYRQWMPLSEELKNVMNKRLQHVWRIPKFETLKSITCMQTCLLGLAHHHFVYLCSSCKIQLKTSPEMLNRNLIMKICSERCQAQFATWHNIYSI